MTNWTVFRPSVSRRLEKKFGWIAKGSAFVLSYVAWLVFVRLLVLSIITYFLMRQSASLQQISENFTANETVLIGISALGFAVLYLKLYPLTDGNFNDLGQFRDFIKSFLPGFFKGGLLALLLVTTLVIAGFYEFLGAFLQSDTTFLLSGLSILARLLSIIFMVYFEEFIFRSKLFSIMSRHLSPVMIATWSALAFSVIKNLQFGLSIMQTTTFFLIGLMLGLRTALGKHFSHGAGILAGLLILFHSVLGLPVLESDMPGIFLMRYLGNQGVSEAARQTATFLTGGIEGPFSGFILQFLLAAQVIRFVLRNKKILLTAPH